MFPLTPTDEDRKRFMIMYFGNPRDDCYADDFVAAHRVEIDVLMLKEKDVILRVNEVIYK